MTIEAEVDVPRGDMNNVKCHEYVNKYNLNYLIPFKVSFRIANRQASGVS